MAPFRKSSPHSNDETKNFVNSGLRTYKGSLGFRIFLVVFALSCLFSIIACLLWTYIDYDTRIEKIDQTFDRIEKTLLPGVSKSIWEVDKEHLQKYIEGISANPNIQYAKISIDDGTVIESGTPVKSDPITKNIEIMYKDSHYSLHIGTLQLQSDRGEVIESIISGLGDIFLFLTFIIFSTAIFFFVVFNKMVAGHLLDIAYYIDVNAHNPNSPPLQLNRRNRDDELDKVVDAFNDMRLKLNQSILDLTQSKEIFSKTFFSAPLLMSISTLDEGEYIEVNDAFLEVTGFEREDVIGRRSTDIGWLTVENRKRIIRELRQNGRTKEMEIEFTAKNGQKIACIYAGEIITVDNVERLLSICLDISEVRRLHQDQETMRSKLSQAQKMEAIGRLAGGVAHDFNNKLTVIMGYITLMNMSGKLDAVLLEETAAIMRAAEQSQDITRQLLAFSRKETISPKSLDLNFQLRDELKVLNRLLGEDIEIGLKLGNDLWPVLMDPAQLDQIIMNLAVNARDAMPHGGKFRFETRNTCLDEDHCKKISECIPGDYVLLQVSDTGYGIEPDLIEHIFEPFFTTKEKGKGTGLGLATVYGIVSQNNGFIDVVSEQGKGTCFNIYLPRNPAKCLQVEPVQEKKFVCGNETILIVEDEHGVLSMLESILGRVGYSIIGTSDPTEAIRICEDPSRRIDLMLTDVVMPKMNGKELQRHVSALRPELKVIFMSGYTDDLISKYGVIEEGVNFISKPINLYDLSVKVRSILLS